MRTQFISIVMGLFSDGTLKIGPVLGLFSDGTLTIGPVLLVVFWLISTDSFCEREQAKISIGQLKSR